MQRGSEGRKESSHPVSWPKAGGGGGQRSGRTFHCRPRALLLRWVSFGDDGTSGTLQCVVKEPASELEPRTELYVADTLKQRFRRTFRTGLQRAENPDLELNPHRT